MRTNVETNDEGFRKELEDVFRKNHHKLFRAACGVLENPANAEDVLHDVFAKVVRAGPSAELIKNPGGYFRRAVVNEAINRIHARDREKLVDADIFDIEALLLVDGPATDDDRTLSLRAAMSHIDPLSHALLTLRFDLGYSCAEIADIFGQTRAAIKDKIRRIQRELHKIMSTDQLPPKRNLNELIANAGEAQ